MLLSRPYKTKSVCDAPCSGRPTKSLISNEIYKFVDCEIEKKNKFTALEFKKINREQVQISFSLAKVRRLRYKLGWIASGKKYCELIRETKKEKWLVFCKKCLEEKDQFQDVIFIGECSVCMESHATITFRRKWDPPIPKG